MWFVQAWLPVLLALALSAQSGPPPLAPSAVALKAAPAASPPPSIAEILRRAAEKQRAAAATQRQAARKQAEMAGARLPDWAEVTEVAQPPPQPLPPLPPCEPITDDLVKPIIEAAATAQDVQPDLLRAVIERESGFRPCAVSAKGARGLMQLMPTTQEQFGVADPFDPKENIGAGAKLLKQLLDKYKGELKLALAAYNAGAGAVDEAAGIPPIGETQDYVEAILKKLGK
jgi:soluble lytic murein transglycosylase-like protein